MNQLLIPNHRSFPLLALLLASLLPALSHPAAAADLSAGEQKAICEDRPSCRILGVTDAGKGENGEPLRIADILLGIEDIPAYFPEDGCRSTEETLDSEKLDGGREIWLLAGTARPVKLLPLCNDGYGAAMVGYDEIIVGENRLTHTQSGGSAWRWDTSKTFRLSPLALVEETDCSYHNAAPNTAELTIVDRMTLEARAYAPAPRADWSEAEIGCPAITADFDKPLQPQPAPDVVAGFAVPVPFDADPLPLPDDTTLGSCGLRLSTDGANGFLIHGDPAPAAEAAELRVIAETPKSLLIQIRDPLAEAAQKAALGLSWTKEPHVEIWTASEGEILEGDDMQGPERIYAQIGINLAGEVNIGTGKPAYLPKVATWPGKDEQGRAVTVLRVSWEDDAALLYGLGVVYAQAEGGKQRRLIASAPIKKNKPLFLPGLWHNTQDETGVQSAACEFSGESHELDL